MVRYTHLFLLVCVLVGFGRFGAIAAQDPAGEIIQLVNQVRANYGLPPYQYNNTLAIAAQNHANWMAFTGTYSHVQTDGSTPQSRANAAGYSGYVSENIVGGTSLTPSQGVTWWTNSAVHFNTMVSNRYTEIGIGYAIGHDQNFYVLVVGNPSGGPPAVVANNGNTTQPDAVAMVAPIVLASPGADGSIVHQVGPGQTIWAIAARYEVPLTDIFLFNNLSEGSVLQPGQSLIIRLADGAAPPPTPTPPAAHLVREGDTLWTIAVWNKVELADLLWLNQLPAEAVLQPGQEIVLRLLPGQAPPPTATPQLTHIVQSGENLWTVAAVHGLSLEQLLGYNPNLTADSVLHIGDEIRVVPEMPTDTPTTAVSPTPTFPPTNPSALAAAATPIPPTTFSTSPTNQPATPIAITTAVLLTRVNTSAVATNSLGNTVFRGTVWLGLGLVALAVVVVWVLRETRW